ncbi:MAG: pyruvoyl-dependent arginine decarboxylase [archaeon]
MNNPLKNVIVVKGAGQGPGVKSALHLALYAAGTHNFNIVNYSSVLPELPKHAPIAKETIFLSNIYWGAKAESVFVDEYAHEPGQWAFAGLGWRQSSSDNSGYLVEEHGIFSSEEEGKRTMEESITADLDRMCTTTPKRLDKHGQSIIGIQNKGEVACAIVQAIYSLWPTQDGQLWLDSDVKRQLANLRTVLEKDYALLAAKDLAQGTRVLTLNGSLAKTPGTDSILVGENQHFLPSLERAYSGRYLRTADAPNLFINTDLDLRPYFFALRDIKKGEQLSYHVGMTDPRVFGQLPADLQKQWLDLREISTYVLKHNV